MMLLRLGGNLVFICLFTVRKMNAGRQPSGAGEEEVRGDAFVEIFKFYHRPCLPVGLIAPVAG